MPDILETQIDVSVALSNLGKAQRILGDLEAARQLYEVSLTNMQAVSERYPKSVRVLGHLSSRLMELGDVQETLGNLKKAESLYQEALALRDRLAHDHPTLPEYQNDLAESHYNLGILYQASGRPERRPRRRTSKPWRCVTSWPTATPPSPSIKTTWPRATTTYGLLYQASGRPEEAEAAYRQALALWEQLTRDQPGVTKYQSDLATSHNHLGVLYPMFGVAHRKSLRREGRIFH